MASPVEPPADPSWKLPSDLFTGQSSCAIVMQRNFLKRKQFPILARILPQLKKRAQVGHQQCICRQPINQGRDER